MGRLRLRLMRHRRRRAFGAAVLFAKQPVPKVKRGRRIRRRYRGYDDGRDGGHGCRGVGRLDGPGNEILKKFVHRFVSVTLQCLFLISYFLFPGDKQTLSRLYLYFR